MGRLSQHLLGGLLFLSLMVAVSCHTNMISINGDKSCVRPFSNDSPTTDIFSDNMKCNGRNSPAGGRCAVAAGSEMTLRWFHGGNGVIDPSHKGPIAVYLAEAGTGGNGNSWFKISEDGFNGQWAVERLIGNGGNWKVRIPSNIRSGDYIVRTELIAHHESFRAGGAQYYIGCADIRIDGGAGGDCGPKVSIPGGGWVPNYDDPTVKVNIYNGLNGYRVPGPAVANCAGGGGGGGNPPPPPPPPPQNNGGGGGAGLENGGVYLLHAGHAQDKCLDAGGDQNGAPVQIYGCWDGAANQRWKLEDRGNGWSLIEQRSHKAIDVWQSHDNGAQTQLWAYGGAANQLWYPERHGDGSYSFKGRFSGKYLDVAGASNQNGARIHQWDGTGAGNQKWFLQRV